MSETRKVSYNIDTLLKDLQSNIGTLKDALQRTATADRSEQDILEDVAQLKQFITSLDELQSKLSLLYDGEATTYCAAITSTRDNVYKLLVERNNEFLDKKIILHKESL